MSAFKRHTTSTRTIKTKGRAPNAMIDFIASILPERIMTSPSAPSTTPQLSLTRVLGLRSPPGENMPSPKAARNPTVVFAARGIANETLRTVKGRVGVADGDADRALDAVVPEVLLALIRQRGSGMGGDGGDGGGGG